MFNGGSIVRTSENMIGEIVSALEDASRVVITTHTRPDGDAIGSQLALGNYLSSKGKKVSMINSDPSPYNLEWLPGSEKIIVYDGSLEHVDMIASADLIVVLDTNNKMRLGKPGDSIKGASVPRILIDHHTDPENWFDLMWRRESASSTGELLYEIFADWDLEGIDSNVAVSLYVAIMTDTGSFRFSNVTPALHRMVADLVERGNLNPAQMYAEVHEKKSIEGLRLMSTVLSTLQLHHGGLVGSMIISKRSLQDSGASIEESDGFVNNILSIEGVKVGLMFTETERGTKVSFRSKEDFQVHKWAQSFGGGGHRSASGAFIKADLETAIERTIAAASKFIDITTTGQDEGISDEDADYLSMLGVQN